MKYLAIILLWVAVIFSRPMALGYAYATYGIFYALSAWVLALTLTKATAIPSPLKRIAFISFLSGLGYSVALLTVGFDIALKTLTLVSVFNLTLIFIPLFTGPILISTSRYILRVIVFSGCITAIYFAIHGIDVLGNDLAFFEFPIKDRGIDRTGFEPIAALRFPLSTLLYKYSTADYDFARSSFLAIEPGIAPLLIVMWRLIEVKSDRITGILLDIVMVLALVSTLASSIPIVLSIFFAGRYVFIRSNRPTFIQGSLIAVALVLGVGLFLFAPVIGYLDKFESHQASFTDRQALYLDGETAFVQIIGVVLVCINILLTFRHMTREKYVMLPVVLLISAINVLAFTPLYFVIFYVFCAEEERVVEERAVLALP